jgi:TonB family protein
MKYLVITLFVLVTTDLFSQTLEPGKFESVDVLSEYPGGIQELYNYISDSLQYPQKAIDEKIEGLVYVYFVMNNSGEIIDNFTKVEQSTNDLFNEEAIRLVNNSIDWIPAKITKNGPSVKSQRVIPIRFMLPKEKKRNRKKK